MTDREARRDAISTWFLEFSVLWAVLPVVDQLLATRPIDVPITAVSGAVSLTTLVVGIMLKGGERK